MDHLRKVLVACWGISRGVLSITLQNSFIDAGGSGSFGQRVAMTLHPSPRTRHRVSAAVFGGEIRGTGANTIEKNRLSAAPCYRTAKGSNRDGRAYLGRRLAGADIDQRDVELYGSEVRSWTECGALSVFLSNRAGHRRAICLARDQGVEAGQQIVLRQVASRRSISPMTGLLAEASI